MNDFAAKFNDIQSELRDKCAVCGKKLIEPAIRLPQLPMTEIFVDSKQDSPVGLVDQNFYFCDTCGHGQLEAILDPNILYGSDYSYRTSMSSASRSGIDIFYQFIQKFTKGDIFDKIIEIGCNDLYLLNLLKKSSTKLIGIDPVLGKGDIESGQPHIEFIADYFENVDKTKLLGIGKTLVLSSHNIEHIADPRKMIKDILDNANSDDICIFQFPGIETLINDFRFDQIFHHHLHYFSLKSIEYLVNDLGGEIIDHALNPEHWGSLIIAFKKSKTPKVPLVSNYSQLLSSDIIKKRFKLFLGRLMIVNEQITKASGMIYGYGAVLTLPIIAYHLNNDLSMFQGILDDDINKNNLYYLNLPVPIISINNFNKDLSKYKVLITAINNNKQIIPKLIDLKAGNILFLTNQI